MQNKPENMVPLARYLCRTGRALIGLGFDQRTAKLHELADHATAAIADRSEPEDAVMALGQPAEWALQAFVDVEPDQRKLRHTSWVLLFVGILSGLIALLYLTTYLYFALTSWNDKETVNAFNRLFLPFMIFLSGLLLFFSGTCVLNSTRILRRKVSTEREMPVFAKTIIAISIAAFPLYLIVIFNIMIKINIISIEEQTSDLNINDNHLWFFYLLIIGIYFGLIIILIQRYQQIMRERWPGSSRLLGLSTYTLKWLFNLAVAFALIPAGFQLMRWLSNSASNGWWHLTYWGWLMAALIPIMGALLVLLSMAHQFWLPYVQRVSREATVVLIVGLLLIPATVVLDRETYRELVPLPKAYFIAAGEGPQGNMHLLMAYSPDVERYEYIWENGYQDVEITRNWQYIHRIYEPDLTLVKEIVIRDLGQKVVLPRISFQRMDVTNDSLTYLKIENNSYILESIDYYGNLQWAQVMNRSRDLVRSWLDPDSEQIYFWNLDVVNYYERVDYRTKLVANHGWLNLTTISRNGSIIDQTVKAELNDFDEESWGSSVHEHKLHILWYNFSGENYNYLLDYPQAPRAIHQKINGFERENETGSEQVQYHIAFDNAGTLYLFRGPTRELGYYYQPVTKNYWEIYNLTPEGNLTLEMEFEVIASIYRPSYILRSEPIAEGFILIYSDELPIYHLVMIDLNEQKYSTSNITTKSYFNMNLFSQDPYNYSGIGDSISGDTPYSSNPFGEDCLNCDFGTFFMSHIVGLQIVNGSAVVFKDLTPRPTFSEGAPVLRTALGSLGLGLLAGAGLLWLGRRRLLRQLCEAVAAATSNEREAKEGGDRGHAD